MGSYFHKGPEEACPGSRPWPAHNPNQGCSLEELDTSCHCRLMLFDLDAQLVPLFTKRPSDPARLQEGRKPCVSGPSDSCTFHGQTGILLCTSIFMQSLGPGTRTWSLYYSTPTSWSLLAENQLVFPQLYCPLSHLNLKHWKYIYKENIHSEVLYLRS